MRAWFHRHERALLLIAYLLAFAAICALWVAHGWRWGLIYLGSFILTLLAGCLVIEVTDHPDDYR